MWTYLINTGIVLIVTLSELNEHWQFCFVETFKDGTFKDDPPVQVITELYYEGELGHHP